MSIYRFDWAEPEHHQIWYSRLRDLCREDGQSVDSEEEKAALFILAETGEDLTDLRNIYCYCRNNYSFDISVLGGLKEWALEVSWFINMAHRVQAQYECDGPDFGPQPFMGIRSHRRYTACEERGLGYYDWNRHKGFYWSDETLLKIYHRGLQDREVAA